MSREGLEALRRRVYDDPDLAVRLRTLQPANFDAHVLRLAAELGCEVSEADELRSAFAAGFVEDALGDVLWERSHGVRKRIAVIAEMLQHIAFREQRIALTAPSSIAARLTVDSAMICVNECLARSGSEARCERSDVEAAFDWMTQPLVESAIWTDLERHAIVVPSLSELGFGDNA